MRSRPPRPAAPRLTATERFRLVVGVLLVLLGAAIVVQGVRLAAPWGYTIVGVLMAGLGAYRLRLAWVLWSRSAESPLRPQRPSGSDRDTP